MIGQQSLSVESSGETPKLPIRVQHLAKQASSSQQVSKVKQESIIGGKGKMQLRKQISMDAVKDRSPNNGGQRGYLIKQMSMDTNPLTRHQQKMSQVNLVKQMSLPSAPDTPRGVRRGLDKRLKKEQGMTILVSKCFQWKYW